MRGVVCGVWGLVWLWALAAPTLNLQAAEESPIDRSSQPEFRTASEGGLWAADPSASGPGDKEEQEESEEGPDTGVASLVERAADPDHAGPGVAEEHSTLPRRLGGRMWLLHCALKLDC
jgi:hypothetical protein